MTTAPAPGIYENIPFEDYLAWEPMSQTPLKNGLESMSHLKASKDGERVMKITDGMTLGSGLHAAFLEPNIAKDKIVEWTGSARRGKVWEAFKADHKSDIVLTPGMYSKLNGMLDSLRAHPEIKLWQDKIESVEVSGIAEIGGLLMKGRADGLPSDAIFDLKKTINTAEWAIHNTIKNYRYDIQGAVYCEIFNRSRFVLAFIEESPPYDVVVYELSPAYLRRGRKAAHEIISAWLGCEQDQIWPGRSDELMVIEPPEDYSIGSGVTMDGVEIGI
jgi:hypothetical protein